MNPSDDGSASPSRRQFLQGLGMGAGALAFGQLLGRAAPLTAANTKDWPCFRGPNHDGTLAEKITLVADEPQVLWRAKVGQGNACLSIVGERAFTQAQGTTDNVICLNARTGAKIWATSHLQGDGQATPTVDGNRLFLPRNDQNGPAAIAVSTEDGRLLWKTSLPKSRGINYYGLAGSARVWEDLVFFNIAGGAALKKDSGEVVWAHEGHTAYATPVMFTAKGKLSVAFFTGDSLSARDARSGRELWTIPWKTTLHVSACDPIFLGDRVFLCSAYGRGRALYDISGDTPRTIWEDHAEHSGNSFASGFVRNGDLFAFTGNSFASLDVATGKLKWEYDGWGRVILIGDTLIWINHRGELAAGPLDAARVFKPVWRTQAIGGTTNNGPAYQAGKIYVRNEAGDIACLRIAQ